MDEYSSLQVIWSEINPQGQNSHVELFYWLYNIFYVLLEGQISIIKVSLLQSDKIPGWIGHSEI